MALKTPAATMERRGRARQWDYAPSGSNLITGMPFTDVENLFMKPGDYVIGRKVKKAQYREYTGSTFTKLRVRPKEWEHLGLMGPLVRAWWVTRSASFSGTTRSSPRVCILTACSTTRARRVRLTMTKRPVLTRRMTAFRQRQSDLRPCVAAMSCHWNAATLASLFSATKPPHPIGRTHSA